MPNKTIRILMVLSAVCLISNRTGDANGQTDQAFDVSEATIDEIHQAISKGKLTCQRLTQLYLDRIRKYDRSTRLKSMVVLNPKALERAEELDKEFRETGKLRPLHGIGVIVKDNYDTHDLPTTAGSKSLERSIPPDDAWQVKKLREAGAIVLGKSNMAEFAFSPYETVSSIGGITRNPYDLNRVPAGSSGGTAAAVAASFGTIGLGTDTGNSIRGPSSHCCLVGIRPTLGLTSRDGIVPLYLRNDIGGPMCRTVRDTAKTLQVIAGHDPADPVTKFSEGKVPKSYLDSLDKDGLKGVRIGVFRTLSDTNTANPQIRKMFAQAIVDLKMQGAELVDPFSIKGLNRTRLNQLQQSLWQNTFRIDIRNYLATLGNRAPVQSLEQIIASKRFHASIRNRLNGSMQSKIGDPKRITSANPADDPRRAELLRAVVAAMDEAKIDAFVFPTWNNPARRVGDLRSPDGNNSFQIPPHTGQPAITVPMGFTENGLPGGLQFVGRPFAESTLFKLAYAYEQATQHRKPPANFAIKK